MKDIDNKAILKFEEANSAEYDTAISNTLFTLHNSFFDILSEEFEKYTNAELVKDHNYEERLTQLCGFDWFNTISYLELMGVEESTLDYLKHVMLQQSKEFNFIFENAFTSLLDVDQKIKDVEEYQQFKNDYLINLYSLFIADLIQQITNAYLPRMIFVCSQFIDDDINEDLLNKKVKDLNYKTLSIISNHLTSNLNKILKEIYSKYGLDTTVKQTTSESKKIPFSDFDKSKTMFKANFSDEELALQTLGLGKTATWDEIKKAYKKLAFEYHPDRNKSKYATQQMEKINSAYNLLKRKINN